MCGQYYKYPFPANLAWENQPHEYPRTSLPFMLVASTFLRVSFFFFFLQKNPKETLVLAEEFVRTNVRKIIMIVSCIFM